MSLLSKIMSWVVKVEKTLIGICLFLATAVIMINVVGRRIGTAPQWGEEAVRYLMIWITFIGSGICFRRSSHYGIDVIRRVNNKTFQKFITVFVLVACGIFAGMLLFFGGKYTAFTMASNQMTAALRWPIWLVYVSVPIGGGLIILHLLEVFLSEVLGVYTIQE